MRGRGNLPEGKYAASAGCGAGGVEERGRWRRWPGWRRGRLDRGTPGGRAGG